MNDNLMNLLREVDPARNVELDAVDAHAWTAMADGVVMTPRPPGNRPVRRWTWRALAAGGAAALLLGGGTAYAGYHLYAQWYSGANDGLTCVTSWDAVGVWNDDRVYGATTITDDPVADCATYAELTGKQPIVDPVAVHLVDGRLVVGPRASVPADATQAPAVTPEQARATELSQSLDDLVDGGQSRCFTGAEMKQFVDAELARLDLRGWTIEQRDDKRPSSPCAYAFVTDPHPRVIIAENFQAESDFDWPETRDALRTQVASQCLTLPEAEKTVRQILGDDHHWPVSARVDPEASCTRVDLKVGGSQQVFLRGPQG